MVEDRTRQLKETHDKLLHQDKMASLGKLAASVVHEINNPIAGILNLIMLIKRIIKEGHHWAEEMRTVQTVPGPHGNRNPTHQPNRFQSACLFATVQNGAESSEHQST